MLALLLFLMGCVSPVHFSNKEPIHYIEHRQQIFDLYSSRDISRLEELLEADIWLLEQHNNCVILTTEEANLLEQRILLIKSMIEIINSVD